jgi:Domain of unknown function (DUF4198)
MGAGAGWNEVDVEVSSLAPSFSSRSGTGVRACHVRDRDGREMPMKGKYMWKMRFLCTTAMVGWMVGVVHAHFIWIEYDGERLARAYFGEWAEDVREKTGGGLDRIQAPRAFLADRTKTLPLERRADHIEIALTGAGDVRLVEDGLAAREDARASGKTKTVFHTKGGRGDTQAVLDLELIPMAANGSTFTLKLRGQPLAKAEVKVFGPPKWQKSLRTDDQGRVTLETPWAGRYVIEVVHVEEKPGESEGESYNRLRHVSTLSFVMDQGIAWTGQ